MEACLLDVVQVIGLAVAGQRVTRQSSSAHSQVEVIDLRSTASQRLEGTGPPWRPMMFLGV